MTNAQGAAYIFAQAVAGMAEIEGMKAENTERLSKGHSLAHDEAAFLEVPMRLGLYHNDVMGHFQICCDE